MYALIRVHIADMNDGHPDVQVSIADLDKDRESLGLRMMESYANFLGWMELIDFMSSCPEVVEEYNQTGYLMYFDREAEPLTLDYWTIREV